MTKKIFEWGKVQRLHLIGWAVFITLEIGLIGLSMGFFGKTLNYALHYILNIILFYSNAHLVLRKSFSKPKPWLRIILLMMVQIGLYIFFRSYLNYLLEGTHKGFSIPSIITNHKSFFQSLWRGLFFIVLSCFYFLFLRFKEERLKREHSERMEYLNELKNKEMQNELNVAKYEYLRAQINPHLLFNTLSFLYDSVRKFNEDAGKAVLNLADLMRFSLETKESPEEFPMLEEELHQIDNLISLNKIRKDKEQYINFDYSQKAKDFQFIPLVVITMVENMLKHGNLQRPQQPGLLRIKLENEVFVVHTTNLINTRIHNSGFNKGMENIEKRMQLAYGNKFTLNYGPRDSIYFDVTLCLQIN